MDAMATIQEPVSSGKIEDISLDTKDLKKQKPVTSVRMSRGDKDEEQEFEYDWDAITEYEVENENGSKMSFFDVYGDIKTIVIFIRHNLCFAAKEYVEDLAKIPRELMEKHRVRLAIIGCGKPKFMKHFRRETGYWAEFYTDTERELYTLMGLKPTMDPSKVFDVKESKHIKSNVFSGMLKSVWRATTYPGEFQGNTDQQGGAFVMGPGNQILYSHVDKHPAGHCPINLLLKAAGVPMVNFEKDRRIIDI